MISNFKLKSRPLKQNHNILRRFRTQTDDNNDSISYCVNYLPKFPLGQKKKTINQPQTLNFKKQKSNKNISIKKNVTKLHTEINQRQSWSYAQKIAIDKIFLNRDFSTLQFKKQNIKESTRISGMNRYIFQDKVGSGTFGIVHKAKDKKTNQIVAIKRVFQDKRYKNRQLQILLSLNHPNVLKIRDSFYTYQAQKQYLNVVMDYFPNNLYESIQKNRLKADISRLKLKVYAYQMFRGLLYLNSINIAHRDIKPQNILVNDANLDLIICDFGSAKKLIKNEPNLSYICSRCYRAPQLIFGCTNYTTQIDMWSAGCILIEMILLQPIFYSDSNIDQLVQIIKILGTPSHEEVIQMNQSCDMEQYKLPNIPARSWQKIIKKQQYGRQFYDLLYKIMRYSPYQRLTPLQALQHPFFDELREQQTYKKLKKEHQIKQLFDFKKTQQIRIDDMKRLIPKWWKQ